MILACPQQYEASPARQREENRESLRLRALDLLQTEIEFVPNAEFNGTMVLEQRIPGESPSSLKSSSVAKELPSHLKRLCESDLLDREQETALFREMNYLKFRANAFRSKLDLAEPELAAIEMIDAMLERAQAIRDHIIKANMRLVISVVKKFVTPHNSFDDLLSDGVMTLMQTVEKFDYSRGFRFSTYAYRSIARAAYRTVNATRNRLQSYNTETEDWMFQQESDRDASSSTEQVWTRIRELTTSMVDHLDRRERFVIRSRYALGSHRRVRTFQYLADKLGVSKERVRQLEHRALKKLREAASSYESDDLFSASMS